ncbi:sensor domain-containing diguanylate cyclase [Granulosicoccaceae sp. 1_MG-2023]|nr:sensor domain-containing diguanylate cyclase [Granulosicoccaceae sp. 1_MG-2023]
MENSHGFLKQVLDSITEHIVVIDETGDIRFVNNSWSAFGKSNACVVGDAWQGVNYLEACDKGLAVGDEFARAAGAGIRSVIHKRENRFYFEYPCHSPTEKRWFMMRVTPFSNAGTHYFVISHQNITERKLAEEEIENLAKTDGLTNIPNRRTFDEQLREEWRRCHRLARPICLALVDLDHFKQLNDDYGHQCGDDCLIRVGKLLKGFVNRPADICARYGGEEFVLVWGDTSLQQAKQLSQSLLKQIAGLGIANKNSPVEPYLTASIGLAEMIPGEETNEGALIGLADRMLYLAKNKGRNRVESPASL